MLEQERRRQEQQVVERQQEQQRQVEQLRALVQGRLVELRGLAPDKQLRALLQVHKVLLQLNLPLAARPSGSAKLPSPS